LDHSIYHVDRTLYYNQIECLNHPDQYYFGCTSKHLIIIECRNSNQKHPIAIRSTSSTTSSISF